MKLANISGRAHLVTSENRAIDIASASGGEFGPSLMSVYGDWERFVTWAPSADFSESRHFELDALEAPSPEPRQVLAIGLNYSEHAAESGFGQPDRLPPVFTKFVTSLSGPVTSVTLPPGGHTDWEVELVAVISTTASFVDEAHAMNHVAGFTVGQDLSERISQLAGPAPQFGLAKSFAGFTPTGPFLVTPDELTNSDDLELGCAVNGEVVQRGRTSDLIFSVSALVAALSRVITLLPGDIIFTGTPAGVGMGRNPQRFLQPGDELVSWVEGIGELHQTFN